MCIRDRYMAKANQEETDSLTAILWNNYTQWSSRLTWAKDKQPSKKSIDVVRNIARNQSLNQTSDADSFTLPGFMPTRTNPSVPCPFTLNSKAASKKIASTQVRFNSCNILGGLDTVLPGETEPRYLPSYVKGKEQVKKAGIRDQQLKIFRKYKRTSS
eukprot:TRINITY_DN1307_c0_g1_i4.p1 TRINITY_DN1307_c0_g1~~TRINITY_DN1307_c0_g1_i4.p1  ORF type:complete len:181 (+),score=46.96 TRINITY_DN1307_c0_g1_i4:70-543(+)